MRISDWSSDVCSSDLLRPGWTLYQAELVAHCASAISFDCIPDRAARTMSQKLVCRSEEPTSELQSLMRTSYAVFCLKTKNTAVRKNSLTMFTLMQPAINQHNAISR